MSCRVVFAPADRGTVSFCPASVLPAIFWKTWVVTAGAGLLALVGTVCPATRVKPGGVPVAAELVASTRTSPSPAWTDEGIVNDTELPPLGVDASAAARIAIAGGGF